MAKRQLKISIEHLSELFAAPVYLSFVLTNGSVVLAKPISQESQTLKIKNSKGHVLHLPLNQIEEIWAEEKVS